MAVVPAGHALHQSVVKSLYTEPILQKSLAHQMSFYENDINRTSGKEPPESKPGDKLQSLLGKKRKLLKA
jgi:hypothetical protein